MALLLDLKNKISSYLNHPYEVEATEIVPSTDYSKLTFGNKGLTCEFAFLFVDIRKSSQLSETYGAKTAAKIYQSFHEINVGVIPTNDGSVRAFDGDRVMGVFSGQYKNNNAVKAAMQIQWAVKNVLNSTLGTSIVCGAGIDYGATLVTKIGKGRDLENQDLVWVGKACNYASHLAHEANGSIIISLNSYNRLDETRKTHDTTDMWQARIMTLKNQKQVNCYESSYSWIIA
jgi:class 3 adenylate cyclase